MSDRGGRPVEPVTGEVEVIADIDTPHAGPVLAVRDLEVRFPTLDGVVQAVRGVSWEVDRGEVLAIVGESGAGKSVTALALMGLLPSSAEISGSARFRNIELLGMQPRDLNQVRGRRVAMVFQDPMTSLNPVYRVGWQVAEAVLTHHEVPRQEAWERAVIAVAMANDPDVIIADEPTTALDVTVQAQILDALEKAQRETGAAVVLITHDLGVVARMADRVNVMYAGRVVESGTAEDIFYETRMPYTLGLLGSLPRLDLERDERLTPIRGAPPSMVNLPPGCPFSPRCPLVQDECTAEEPALVPTETAGHTTACIRWRELSGAGVGAHEVFGASASDDASEVEAG